MKVLGNKNFTWWILAGALLFVLILVSFTSKEEVSPELPLTPDSALVAGEVYPFGLFREIPPQNGRGEFTSSDFGISFAFPDGYLLFESGSTEGGGRIHNFALVPKEPALETIARTEAGLYGEWPYSIIITLRENPEDLSLEEWMHNANPAYTNYHPEDPSSVLEEVTIGGVEALKHHSNFGLYASEYATLRHGEWIVQISGASELKEDFNFVLENIRFLSSVR